MDQKFIKKLQINGQFWRGFLKPEVCGQTVLPDRPILIGQKRLKNDKIEFFTRLVPLFIALQVSKKVTKIDHFWHF